MCNDCRMLHPLLLLPRSLYFFKIVHIHSSGAVAGGGGVATLCWGHFLKVGGGGKVGAWVRGGRRSMGG